MHKNQSRVMRVKGRVTILVLLLFRSEKGNNLENAPKIVLCDRVGEQYAKDVIFYVKIYLQLLHYSCY